MKISKLLFSVALLAATVVLTTSAYAEKNENTGRTIQVNDTVLVLNRVADSQTGGYEAFFILKNGGSELKISDFDPKGFAVTVPENENIQWVEWENLYIAQLENVNEYQVTAFEDFKYFVNENPDFFDRYRSICDGGTWYGGLLCDTWCVGKGRKGGYCSDSEVCVCYKK